MHEASLVDALFDQIESSIAGQPAGIARATGAVRLVRVRVGELAGVDPELFGLAFDALRGERGCGDAALDLAFEPAAWRCVSCGTAALRGEVLRCPACDDEVKLVAGADLVLERIEFEVSRR